MTTDDRSLAPADSAYPLPTGAMILGVTPEMASDWLTSRRWPHNRRISKAIVAKYLKDMREGRWKTTRQGVIFDTEGYLIDGQHRLRALANLPAEEAEEHYGHPWIDLWIYPDEPTDTFDAYDQNFRRIASHLIDEPNAVSLASGARFLTAVADLDPWSFPRYGRLTTSEILATKRDWPELSRYVTEIMTVHTRTGIPIPPHLAVICQAARSEYGTPERIASWFEGLRVGADMAANDPRLKLRDRFMNDHRGLGSTQFRPLVYSMITKAWNAYALGEGLGVLRWRAAERIPRVVGFTCSSEPTDTTKESND